MNNVASTLNHHEDAFWWQGSWYQIKARGESTGGAVGVVEASFYKASGRPCMSTAARTKPST